MPKTHPTHKTRFSDSSFHDEVCEACGGTDAAGDLSLGDPCPATGAPKPVKTVTVFLKHDDRASLTLIGRDGQTIGEFDGYLPELGIFGGDDTKLSINNDTGEIIGWKRIQAP